MDAAGRVEPLACTGREYDRDGQPIGDPCGRQYTARDRHIDVPSDTGDPRYDGWGRRPPTTTEQDQEARAAGWRLGPTPTDGSPRHVMCPRCSRPDQATTATIRSLTEEHR